MIRRKHQAALCWRMGGVAVAVGLSGAIVQPAAAAEDKDVGAVQEPRAHGSFYIHLGPGGLLFDTSAVVQAGGASVPNASVKIDPNRK